MGLENPLLIKLIVLMGISTISALLILIGLLIYALLINKTYLEKRTEFLIEKNSGN